MQVVSGSTYKDATPQDFNHYFGTTAMKWRIGIHKARLFLVNQTDGDSITGTYLTRQKEWKEKKIPFAEWWASLDPILPHPIMFNMENGCGTWFPNLARNMRKSFPWYVNQIQFRGRWKPEEITTQSIGHLAFSDFYQGATLPTLADALYGARLASVTQGDFIVDKDKGSVLYRKALIGDVTGAGHVSLNFKSKAFKDLMLVQGAHADKITIKPQATAVSRPPAAGEEENRPPLHMVDNLDYLEETNHTRWQGQDYYVVMYTGVNIPRGPRRGATRTYRGPFPGHRNISARWEVMHVNRRGDL